LHIRGFAYPGPTPEQAEGFLLRYADWTSLIAHSVHEYLGELR